MDNDKLQVELTQERSTQQALSEIADRIRSLEPAVVQTRSRAA